MDCIVWNDPRVPNRRPILPYNSPTNIYDKITRSTPFRVAVSIWCAFGVVLYSLALLVGLHLTKWQWVIYGTDIMWSVVIPYQFFQARKRKREKIMKDVLIGDDE